MLSLRAFARLWWGTIRSPTRTLRRVAAEPSLIYPTVAAIVFPLLYSASLLWGVLFLGAGKPSWEPWVAIIPKESYYHWEVAFLIPWSLLLWVLFGALGHLFARVQGGTGRFEATLASLAFALSVPLATLFWLPDFLQALAGVLWGWPFHYGFVAVYGTLATLWALVLAALALRVGHGLNWPRALLAASLALALGYGPGVALLIR